MTSRASLAALVPMRHNSERVPGKNYRNFAGRPLYTWILDTLIEAGVADVIVVDTDSPIIRDGCREAYPDVLVVERPEALRAGEIPMNEVLLNTLRHVETEYCLQTHSTNPLLRSDTIRAAVQAFQDRVPDVDSLFSVTRLQTRLWDQKARPLNHDPAVLLRTQDLPPVFEENSCLYLFSVDTLRSRGNRIGARPLMWEIEPEEAKDIDVELDFKVAEFLHLDRRKQS